MNENEFIYKSYDITNTNNILKKTQGLDCDYGYNYDLNNKIIVDNEKSCRFHMHNTTKPVNKSIKR